MRLAIFSDIHANFEALSAVLEAYRTRTHRRVLLPGRHGRLRRQPERVREHRARRSRRSRSSATTTPPSPGAWTTRTTTRPPATRSTRTRPCSDAREHGVAEEPAVQAQARRHRACYLCHGSPVRLEEFEYIFAPEQARECLPICERARPHHAHRPLAPVQGVRARARATSRSCRRSTSTLRRRAASTSSASARSASRATTTTARATRSTTRDTKRFEFKRVEYDIETAADEDLRAQPRAQLRPPPVHRRVADR